MPQKVNELRVYFLETGRSIELIRLGTQTSRAILSLTVRPNAADHANLTMPSDERPPSGRRRSPLRLEVRALLV